jgi:hypothetical protein
MHAKPHMCVEINDFNICVNSHRWFILCLVYIAYPVLVVLSVDRIYLYRLTPTEYVSPEDGDRIQSPKCFVF